MADTLLSPRGTSESVEDSFFVSVIVPCRSEAKFIGTCLDSILANDYPKDRLEVLVVDGMSQDGTRETVEDYANRDPCIRLLDNPKRITPAALNTGIAQAKGQILMRMDAHARYNQDYISKSVSALDQYQADNVGGIMITLPQRDSLVGRAIAACLSHRFGVGNSYFRIHTDKPMQVDTVFGGCYKREIFERIGLFNERLACSQDIEFNRRVLKAGGKILLVPEIVSYYYARSDLRSFAKHNFRNGVWAILPFAYSDVMPVSLRHLVPLGFVAALLGTSLLGLLWRPAHWLLLAILLAYGLSNLAASAQVAWRERDPRYLLAMPLTFGMLHFGYGLGSCWGVAKLASVPEFWRKIFRLGGQHGAKNGREES